MPTWGEVLASLQTDWQLPDGSIDLDGLRRQALVKLYEKTQRNVVTYYTDWTSSKQSEDLSVRLDDVHGLMEVFKDLDPARGLDLILHSPGGDPTAADSLVRYMRNKFSDVRVFVPMAAMSAATMWALAGDVIVLGRQSQLGPIDPQLGMPHGMVPAGAITRQFARAQAECASDPSKLSAWVPTLQQYFPGLLEMCDDATRLSRALVEEYMRENMFKDHPDREAYATRAADYFADDTIHIAHSRGIHRDQLESLNLNIQHLEDDDELQELVLTLHHTYMHTFGISGCVKIVENHLGRAMIRNMPMQMGVPMGMPMPPGV